MFICIPFSRKSSTFSLSSYLPRIGSPKTIILLFLFVVNDDGLIYVFRAPSKLLDGTQSVTTKVAGTVRKVKLLKPLVDVTAGPVTGILGTTSRLLGKPVTQPPKVIFLYKRPIDKYSRTDVYKNAIKAVIGLALNNVIFHGAQMKGEIVWDLDNMPVLAKLKEKLEQINVPKTDVDAIIKVLACNGKRDPPKQIVPKVRIVRISSLTFLNTKTMCPTIVCDDKNFFKKNTQFYLGQRFPNYAAHTKTIIIYLQ